MAPNWTPSQPAGAGAGTLNDELLGCYEGQPVNLTAAAAASYSWTFVAGPSGENVTIVSPGAQVATWTPTALGITRRVRIRLTTPGGSRILALEVSKNSAGATIGLGLPIPAFGERVRESANGGGAWSVFERMRSGLVSFIGGLLADVVALDSRVDALEASPGGDSFTEYTGSVSLQGAATWIDLTGDPIDLSGFSDFDVRYFLVEAIVSTPAYAVLADGPFPVDAGIGIMRPAGVAVLRSFTECFVTQENAETSWQVGPILIRLVDTGDGSGSFKVQASRTGGAAIDPTSSAVTVRIRERIVDEDTGLDEGTEIYFADPDDAEGASLTFASVKAALETGTYSDPLYVTLASFGGDTGPGSSWEFSESISIAAADNLAITAVDTAGFVAGTFSVYAQVAIQQWCDGSITWRATGDAADTMTLAVVSAEAKLSSLRSIRIACGVGLNAILEGSAAYLNGLSNAFVLAPTVAITATGNCNVSAAATLSCIGSGEAILRGGSLAKIQAPTYCTLGNTSADRIMCRWLGAVTVPTATTSTLATFVRTGAKAGSKPSTVRAHVLVSNAAGDGNTYTVDFAMRPNGSNGVQIGSAVVTAWGTLEIAAGITVSVDNDTNGVRVRLNNTTGADATGVVTGFEFLGG